jgi:hypothetical protein
MVSINSAKVQLSDMVAIKHEQVVDKQNDTRSGTTYKVGSAARGLTVMQHDEPSLAFARRRESSCRTA